MVQFDPYPSVEFLRSGPTFSYDVIAFRFYKAAVRDLRQSAISRPWRLHLNFSCQVESNGWFFAIKLIARISGPGQERKFVLASKLPVKGRGHSVTCRKAVSRSSAKPDVDQSVGIGRQCIGDLPSSIDNDNG